MKKYLLLATAASLFTFSSATHAEESLTRGEVEQIVKEYLITNPQVVVDALEAFSKQEEEKAAARQQKMIKDNRDKLLNSEYSPSVGPKDSDIAVVEFFDYHCGYCKRMLPTIVELLDKHKNVRVIMKELPILSEDSEMAARASIAFYKLAPQKYMEFHTVLMNHKATYDPEFLQAEAKKLGVDGAELITMMNADFVTEELDANSKLAEAIGVRGTPAIIVGDTLKPGALPYNALEKLVLEELKK